MHRLRCHLRAHLAPWASAAASLLAIAAPAAAQQQSTMVPPPPPVSFEAFDPSKPADDYSNPDIPSTYYNICQVCSPSAPRTIAGCPNIIGTQYDCMMRCHVVPSTVLSYSTEPPNTGSHFALPWRNMGESSDPVPRGRYVHSFEHGAVGLLYNCPNGCNSQLAIYRAVLQANAALPVFMSADPDLIPGADGNAFAAVAWSWALTGSSLDQASLNCFVQQHNKRGPECNQAVDGVPNATKCPTFCDKNGANCSQPRAD